MADILFDSKMTSFKFDVKKENLLTTFTLQVTEETSVRSFVKQFKYPVLDVFASTANGDIFDKISIPCSDYLVKYKMNLGDLEFEVKLENISATIRHTKDGTPYTIYTLKLVKELDKDTDMKLATFVKYKEIDSETGKKVPKFFNTKMTIIDD